MIEKDESPIAAVRPTDAQRVFLKRIVKESTEYDHAPVVAVFEFA